MIRAFDTHRVRKTQELSGSLWDFATLPREGEPVRLKMPVPGCWQNEPETLAWRGRAKYEKKFAASGNVRLEFKGVSHTARVLVDGEMVKEHYNAYTPFSVVLKKLPAGEHMLEVLVDNSFGPDSALHVPNDYQTYGGITRPVALEELAGQYVSCMHFTPSLQDGKWYASVEASVENLEGVPFEGRLELLLDGREFASVPVRLEAEEKAMLTVPQTPWPDAEAWCPENPRLYLLSAVLYGEGGEAKDDLIDRVGFREVRTRGKDILLNGQKLQIRGFCRHEDHPQFGCSLPWAAMCRDLSLMRDLGANSVRTSHYPNDELFLDLCDETGMLVWEENHARGLSEEGMRNPNFERQCEDCIREMIGAHFNHPSIYIWGILNECASHTQYGRECYQKQLELIRSLDHTRPRSFASCQFKTDICFDLVDVVSYNIYPLWYHDTPVDVYLKDLYGWVQEETGGSGKPFLITEVGAGAIYGYRTPEKVKWSEEYQAQALEKQLSAILSQEGCSGVYIWQFCDCRVCDSWFHIRPRTMNNKGVVDEYRRPKLAYETVKKMFGGVGKEES